MALQWTLNASNKSKIKISGPKLTERQSDATVTVDAFEAVGWVRFLDRSNVIEFLLVPLHYPYKVLRRVDPYFGDELKKYKK